MARLNWSRATAERRLWENGFEPICHTDRTLIGGRPTQTAEPLTPAPEPPTQTSALSPNSTGTWLSVKNSLRLLRPKNPAGTGNKRKPSRMERRRLKRQLQAEAARVEQERTNKQHLQQSLLLLKQEVAAARARPIELALPS